MDTSVYTHKISKQHKAEILEAAQTHQFKKVERLAQKYGVATAEAAHLADVARLEHDLSKYQKAERAEYRVKKM